MRKVVTGVLAVLALTMGGYALAASWAQHRANQEVELAFAAIAPKGGSLRHGAVDFDLWRGELSLFNVVAERAGEAKAAFRIGSIQASGITPLGAGRVSAKRLEIGDLEIDWTIGVDSHVICRIPQLAIVDYSGPPPSFT